MTNKKILEQSKNSFDWNGKIFVTEQKNLHKEIYSKKIMEGWIVDRRHYQHREDESFRKEVIEQLYACISPGGSPIIVDSERMSRLKSIVDNLSIELVGGCPESFIDYS